MEAILRNGHIELVKGLKVAPKYVKEESEAEADSDESDFDGEREATVKTK